MRKYFYLFINIFLLVCCSQQEGDQYNDNGSDAEKEPSAICMWEGTALRDAPSKKAKWLSSISLGEKVIMLADSAIDSADNNRVFYHIRLSDGNNGWAQALLLVPNAKLAVITEKAGIHKRPDLLTAKKTSFQPMEMIAIVKEKNDWIEVIGNKRKKKGWIKNSCITLNEVDVTVAILTNKALADKDVKKQQNQINEIVNNPEFKSSQFLPLLRKHLDPFTVDKVVTVETALEFIKAIGSNIKIELKAKTYNISDIKLAELTGVNEGSVYETDYVTWYEGGELYIHNVENFVISGSGDRSSNIISEVLFAPVISFRDVNNVSIKNIKAGHKPEEGYCDGGVFQFLDSENIFIANSELFGSGTEGLWIENVNHFECKNTDIRSCTFGIMYIGNSDNLVFSGGSYYDNYGYEFISIDNSNDILFSELTIRDNKSEESEGGVLFYVSQGSNLTLEDLYVVDNKISIFADPDGFFDIGYIMFENNSFDEEMDYEGEEGYYEEEEEYYE